MLQQLAIIWVCVMCMVGGAKANKLDDYHVYSAGDVFYESLVEIGRQSTVYSFNFNNLVIILILKFLVLLFGGGLGFGFLGRSFEQEQEQSWVDSNDMMFFMTYLVSDGIEKYDCLNKMACLDDYKAQDLVTASSMLLKGARYLQPFIDLNTEKYETITYGLQDAIDYKRYEWCTKNKEGVYKQKRVTFPIQESYRGDKILTFVHKYNSTPLSKSTQKVLKVSGLDVKYSHRYLLGSFRKLI